MATRNPDDHERSAAGMDFEDDPIRERASSFGAKMAEGGPEALLDELENLLPEAWRDQIRTFPIAAVAVGIGVGVWLGLKKSDDILTAGSSMLSAAALANVSSMMDRTKGTG